MKYLEYPLSAEGYVNRFLVSGVFTQAQQFTKATLSGKVNEWLKEGFSIHENPCRKEFTARRRARLPEYDDFTDAVNGSTVQAFGETGSFQVYFPFGNPGVDASAFYYEPVYLRMYAVAQLCAGKDEEAEFELETCGGMTLWINGRLIEDFAPFTRNMVKRTTVLVPLRKGDNRCVICLEDLAERDTDYFFRLRKVGGMQLTIKIPVEDHVDQSVLDRMEKMFGGMYFDKEAYISEPVILNMENLLWEPVSVEFAPIPGGFEGKVQDIWESTGKRLYKLECGQKQIRLFHSDEIPPGYYCFAGRMEHRGVELFGRLGSQMVRQEFLDHQEEKPEDRRRAALEAVAQWEAESTRKAAALLKLGRERERAESILRRELDNVRKRRDCADFHFIVMLYVYRVFGDVISRGLKRELEEAMTGFRYWIDEPGDDVMWFFSENHALLFHSLQYLAGSWLPERFFTNSGRKGTEVKRRGEELLCQWFDAFFREFVTEWNSNAYIPVDVLGLGMLYNLTDETDEFHEKAKKALDMIFWCLAVNSHKGAVMTSFGRTYEKEMKGSYGAGTTSLLYAAYNKGYLNQDSMGYLSLVLGDYEAPGEYGRYAGLRDGEELIFQNSQGFERMVNLYLYKTSRVLLSTAVGFKPFQPGYQEHIIEAVIDETAQVFVNHPGETFPYGSGRPGFWQGNKVLPMAAQYLDTAIIRYHIGSEERTDYTHGYFPVNEFDAYRQEDNILAAEKDGAYIAVKALNGLVMQTEGSNRLREFVSPGRDNVWVVRVGHIEEYGSLEKITEAWKSISVQMDGESTQVRDDRGTEYVMDRKQLLLADSRKVYEYPMEPEGKLILRKREERQMPVTVC